MILKSGENEISRQLVKNKKHISVNHMLIETRSDTTPFGAARDRGMILYLQWIVRWNKRDSACLPFKTDCTSHLHLIYIL